MNDVNFSTMYAFPYEKMLVSLEQQGWSVHSITFSSEGPPGRHQIKAATITLKRDKRAFDDEHKPVLGANDFRDAVKLDHFTRKEDEKLTKSQVPTADEAAKLALSSFLNKPGLDARESWRVSGLYRIGQDVTDFAKAGDLVWEVHITRAGDGVSGVVWVSTTTKNAKVLFPVDP